MALVSPNLVYRCILVNSQWGLKMGWFDLNLQVHLGSKLSKSAKNRLVRTITFKGLKLGHQIWPLGASWVNLGWDCIWWYLTLTFKVIWGQNYQNRLRMGLFIQLCALALTNHHHHITIIRHSVCMSVSQAVCNNFDVPYLWRLWTDLHQLWGGGRVAGGTQGSSATGRWDGQFGWDRQKSDFRNTCLAGADAGGAGVGASLN